MRTRVIGTMVVVTMALMVSACGEPVGTDGNLLNGWAMLAAPAVPAPASAACYDVQATDPAELERWPEPVSCVTAHTVETFYVGRFEGAAAAMTLPPPQGGSERKAAYAVCTQQAERYLGADWRTGRIDLFLVAPTEVHWEAGAREYRCDLVEYQDLESFAVVSRDAALGHSLEASGVPRLGCARIKTTGETVDEVTPASCSDAHNGEFAGVYDHPDGEYPSDSSTRSRANLDGCRNVVATYAGIPNDKDFQYRVGQVATPFTKADWELGNRGVRCYVWTPRDVTFSVKGAGTGGLPINYA